MKGFLALIVMFLLLALIATAVTAVELNITRCTAALHNAEMTQSLVLVSREPTVNDGTICRYEFSDRSIVM